MKKLGAYYSYGDLRLGQGREASKAYLREHPELADEIDGLVRTAAGVRPIASRDEQPAEEPVPDAVVSAPAELPIDV